MFIRLEAMMISMMPLALSPAVPEIVFTARYYYPAGDKRKSTMQVFAARKDGSARRAISPAKQEAGFVRWISDFEIVYSVEGAKLTWTYVNFRTGATRPEPALTDSYPQFGPVTDRGNPLFSRDQKDYRREKGVWKETTFEPSIDIANISEPREMKVPAQSSIQFRGAVDTKGAPSRDADDEDRRFQFDRGTESLQVRSPHWPAGFLPGSTAERSYLYGFEGGGSAGAFESVTEMNWKTKSSRLVVPSCSDLNWSPTSRYYTCSEAGRPMAALGKLQVWTNRLYVGDLRTNRRWPVVSGVVLGGTIDIRPDL